MPDRVLTRYRYVKEYDTRTNVKESLIYACLQNAWKITPSKNNFMPYRVQVVGPKRRDLKTKIYNLCIENERKFDDPNITIEEFYKKRYTDKNSFPQYHNIMSAPYIFVFSQRHAENLNPWQQNSVDEGRTYEQMHKDNPAIFFKTSALEIGMFANNLARECLANGLDISHTLCTPTAREFWEEEEFPLNPNDHRVMLVMTAGKASYYREDVIKGTLEAEDLKPAFEDIVQIL